MLSTTEPQPERGQSLVIFALALPVLLGFAALAFDLGQIQLDRRSEQNAADAAALAGARYIASDVPRAKDEAMRIAYQNGLGAGSTYASSGLTNPANGSKVTVSVPPGPESAFAGRAGYIEVQIGIKRSSLFAGVLGFAKEGSGAMATGANLTGVAANYSILLLDPHACSAAKFQSGSVIIGGNIQVDSDCTTNTTAFDAGGGADIEVTASNGSINVVGGYRCQGSGTICSPTPATGQPYVPDPMADLPAPALPATPAAPVQIAGSSILAPGGCPGQGSSSATAAAPATCVFNSNYAATTWTMSPGYYPGGISLQSGTFFLLPGVYYIGGGGFNASANNSGMNVYSIDAAWPSTTPPSSCTVQSFSDCGGVMFYNTNDPSCASNCGSSTSGLGPIKLTGSGPVLQLYPIQNAGPYTNVLVFQDRALAPVGGSSGDVSINASTSVTIVGAIYVPRGLVSMAGGGDLGTVQMIANQLSVNGTGTAITDFFFSGAFPQLHAVGLVE